MNRVMRKYVVVHNLSALLTKLTHFIFVVTVTGVDAAVGVG